MIRDPFELTPVEEHGGYLVKRDDLFAVGRARGGKARACWALAQGASGLVTASHRVSPQVQIVAEVGRVLGLPVRCHVPTGPMTPELASAEELGAELIRHYPGHNSVICARARVDAQELGWREVPFGMECQEAVDWTARQVANLPRYPRAMRVVVAVGSGASLAGVLAGLAVRTFRPPVLGIKVGSRPERRLAKYGPPGWEEMVELRPCARAYGARPPLGTRLGELELDPVYEAQLLDVLEPGDLLWAVGIRGLN